MARSWKLAAGMVAWLGVTAALQAQTPPPPVPIGPSGIGGFPIAQQPAPGPMGPMGPMGPWQPPMPGGPGRGPGGPGLGMPPAPGMMPNGQHNGNGDDPLELDSKTVRQNAFGCEEGGDYRPIRSQLNLEYLVLWFKSHRHPILATTGDPNDPIPGALGQPGTQILHGDRTGPGASNALRVTYTWWLVDPEIISIDTSFMIMEQRRLPFHAVSDDLGQPVISRPFFNATANTEDADPRALPFVMRGSANDSFLTRLMGAEANFKYNVTGRPSDEGLALVMFAGPRWIRLDEKYQSSDFSQDLPAGTGESRTFSDNVTCYNNFIGGQIGSALRWRWDRLTMDFIGKIAVGENFQTLKTSGTFTQTDDATGTTTVANEGLFVQSTNSGNSHSHHVSVVPEFDFNIGFFLTDNFRFSVGAGVFTMNNVLRPGNVLDRRIEVQAPGIPTTFPVRRFAQTDLWVDWVSFGFEFVY
jgi:Putative beta barrel porin-7 (BBP7)